MTNKKEMRLKPEMIGAKTYIREVNVTTTVNEANIPLLLKYGRTEFFEDAPPPKNVATEVVEIDTSEEVEKHRKELNKFTHDKLKEMYKGVKAKTKKELINKVVTGNL